MANFLPQERTKTIKVMKVIAKTGRRTIIQVQADLLDQKGFDYIWDQIRSKYPMNKFDVFEIVSDFDDEGKEYLIIELAKKKKAGRIIKKKVESEI